MILTKITKCENLENKLKGMKNKEIYNNKKNDNIYKEEGINHFDILDLHSFSFPNQQLHF